MTDNFLKLITLGMGNAKSKRKDRPGRNKARSAGKGAHGPHTTRDHDFTIDIHERWSEDTELKIIRRTIDKDPEMFILNNLMMCVQFFENYDEEISGIRDTLVSSREAELNARFTSQKHALVPDVLQQHVARKIDFTYMLPNLEHTIEHLQPIRIYVVFDNIEVTEKSYASAYCTLNETITYSMQLKPSRSHKGYVQLQRLEVNPSKRTASADDLRIPAIANGTRDEIYSDGDSIYGSKSSKIDGAAIAKSKNANHDNNDERAYRQYGSQENIFESARIVRAKGDDASGPSSEENYGKHDVAGIRDEGTTKVKPAETRRGRSKNSGGQYGSTKLVCSANESLAGSTSSGYRSGNYMDIDSDCSYAQTTYSNTPKTSKSSLNNAKSEIFSTKIPDQCFRKVEYRADGTIYDARKERKQKMTVKEQRVRQAHQSRNYHVWYLNSMKFMKYFCQLFTEQLAIPMGFDPETDDDAHGCVIYRDKVEILEGTMSTKLETFEIVPCISSQWPQCAQEWIRRSRYSWPHCDVIEKVKEYGCHIIPESSIAEKSSGKLHDLEWQLIFPAAERYLETCLTYPQVRVYLMSLMLHKTFIRPVDLIFGLTTSHIKNRLFWLIEDNDRADKWMENRTGESLMRLLNSLYRSISQDEPNLPDYFIKEKNLFQENSCLLRTQKQLKRIIENPVMYVFHAMENIRYRHSRTFFPRLNYEELLRILTVDKLTLVHPELSPQRPVSGDSAGSFDKDYDQVGGLWDDVKQKNFKAKARARKPVTNKSLINPRKADDQVVEIPTRCASMEPQRLASLLDFFIKHFIKMAECCHKYGAVPQKMAYVEQAERLSVLLTEHQLYKDDAKTYLERLCSLKRRAANSRTQIERPETPKRNPDMPVFTRAWKDRYQTPDIQEEIVAVVDQESEQGETSETLRPLTRVMIHEENTKIPESVELRTSENVATAEKQTAGKMRSARVVSLTDQPEESFLTETTYI